MKFRPKRPENQEHHEALVLAREKVKTCIMCHSRKLKAVACFVPEDPNFGLGTPEGKIRTYWYGICYECYDKEGILDRITEKIDRIGKHEPHKIPPADGKLN